jgi:outer membrane protein TolC
MSLVGAVALLFVASVAAAQPITADEAVARALAANPTLRASEAERRSAHAATVAAEGARTPSLVMSAQGTYQESFAGTSMGVTRNSSRSLGGNAAVRYTTDIGTEIEVGVAPTTTWRTVNLTPGTTTSATVGPNYAAQATVDARQPLLRGRGEDAVLGSIRQAREAERASGHARDQAASQLALDVLLAWFELWYAENEVGVQTEALAIAQEQLDAARARESALGTASRADVLSFASQHASIRESLEISERTKVSRAIVLGRLLAIPPARALSLVAAGDLPPMPALPPTAELVRQAHARSSSLLALEAQRDALRLRVTTASNAAEPRLDLTASVAVAGLWNESTIESLQLPGDRPAFGGALGLELELPLGTSQLDGQRAEAQADLEAAEARYAALAAELEANVATLRAEIESRGRELALAEESARVARELAEAERGRLALGTTTPLSVVQAQQTHRESELRELRATVDRLVARFQLLDHVGALLDHFHTVEPPP